MISEIRRDQAELDERDMKLDGIVTQYYTSLNENDQNQLPTNYKK